MCRVVILEYQLNSLFLGPCSSFLRTRQSGNGYTFLFPFLLYVYSPFLGPCRIFLRARQSGYGYTSLFPFLLYVYSQI
jgi:hypothetical protein